MKEGKKKGILVLVHPITRRTPFRGFVCLHLEPWPLHFSYPDPLSCLPRFRPLVLPAVLAVHCSVCLLDMVLYYKYTVRAQVWYIHVCTVLYGYMSYRRNNKNNRTKCATRPRSKGLLRHYYWPAQGWLLYHSFRYDANQIIPTVHPTRPTCCPRASAKYGICRGYQRLEG